MLKLTISRDTLTSFRDGLCQDQPIHPGEGGWTFDKMMMLAGLCHLLPLSMDSPTMSYKGHAEAGKTEPIPEEVAGNSLGFADADVIAATVCCRYAALSLERGYWDGENVTHVVGVGLRARDWEVEIHPVAGAEIDVGTIMGILPIGGRLPALPPAVLQDSAPQNSLLSAAQTVQGSVECLAQAMDRTAFRDALVSKQPQQAEEALNQLLELSREQWQLVQDLEAPPKEAE